MYRKLIFDVSQKIGSLGLSRGMAKKPVWPPAPFPVQPALDVYKHLSNTERKNQGYPCQYDEPSLVVDEVKARTLIRDFNTVGVDNTTRRSQILQELLHPDCNTNIVIQPPFYVDYGLNIKFGDNCFVNFDCIFLDTAPITIGFNCLFAPRVSIFTATHPLEPVERQTFGLAKPIKIGNNVWIGGAAVIYPGVTIGDGVVVAAGAAVVKDIPAYCIVGGNPAQIVRYLPGASEPKDPPKKK